MKLIIVLLIGTLSFSATLLAATVSGEINSSKIAKTQKNPAITAKAPTIKYYK